MRLADIIKFILGFFFLLLLGVFLNKSGFLLYLRTIAEDANSVPIFLLCMGIGCAFGLPVSFFYVTAGIAFGMLKAWEVCVVSLILSSSIGYLLGRFVLPRKWIESKIFSETENPQNKKYSFLRNRRLSKDLKTDFNLNFYIRAIPGIPYWIQNLFLGAISLNFFVYLFVNIVVQGAISFAMICLGGAVVDYSWYSVVIIVLLVVFLTLFHRLGLLILKRKTIKP